MFFLKYDYNTKNRKSKEAISSLFELTVFINQSAETQRNWPERSQISISLQASLLLH